MNSQADRCAECGMDQPQDVHVMAHEDWCCRGMVSKAESEKATASLKAKNLSNAELADELIANLWADIPARKYTKCAVLSEAIIRLRCLPPNDKPGQ